MKRCPQCQTTYAGDTIKFCRHDGTPLTEEFSLESSPTRPLPSVSRVADAPTQPLHHTASIAVLPFANMSADPENDYFCDGLAEELLNALAKIEALQVAARTSAFSFKGREIDVGEIGRKLNVSTVLQGSVRKASNRLRITAQLVNVADGYQIWSERYERDLKDIFDIQDEISLAIVEALRVKLLGAEKATVLRRYTENTEAYQLYLKGRYHYAKWHVNEWKKAIEYYEQAIAKEPDYAPAWAGIAEAQGQLWYFGHVGSDSGARQFEMAVARTLEVDQTLPESHLGLGKLKFWYEWDWPGAEQEIKQSLALNPNNAEAHASYGYLFATNGRQSQAIREANRALELDPLSLYIIFHVAWIFWLIGEYDLWLEQGRKLVELEPHFFGVYWITGIECWMRGAHEEAIAEFQKAVSLNPGPLCLSYVGCLYGQTGEREKALQVLDELQTLSAKKYVQRYCFAMVYAGLGEMERAFEWLERAFEQREGVLVLLKPMPLMIPALGADPRFAHLLQRIGLLA
jgi:adenylate cyclase